MSKPVFILPSFALLLSLGTVAAPAAETDGPVDKSAFNLFKPVPENLMRELEPDRPDATENPHTVDAGHFQLEMDFANFTYNHGAGETVRAWNIAPMNLKAGLLNNVDLQFVLDNYVHVRTEDHATGTTTHSGFGDFTTRLKINLWGNDGGQTAFGLLPYVKFPTSTDHLGNNAVEGGVIFPFAVTLPLDFELGAETAAGIFRDENDNNHHEEFIASVTVDHAIVGNLSGYLEFFSNFTTERHSDWIGTVDLGLEFSLTKNIQLDCGSNVGVTHAADTAHAFSGVTIRF
jgi:hypothetical protein